MVAATLPAGIPMCQYPGVIYPTVCSANNPTMEETEHWRLRLIELKQAVGCTQAAMAAAIGVDASYFSRLLYPPGKKGRKNLGLDTLRSLIKVNTLSADWFDLPLGSKLPNSRGNQGGGEEVSLSLIASEPRGRTAASSVKWPFKETSYKRLNALVDRLGPKLGEDAIRDLDSLLDVAVSRWEQRAARLGKHAS